MIYHSLENDDGNDDGGDDGNDDGNDDGIPEGPIIAHTFPGGIVPQQSFKICFLPE